MFDWDDLRVFLAAARTGSLNTAGDRLTIDGATVGRRVARLESALKSTLFVRSQQGLQLTAAGAQLLEAALDAEAAMDAALRVTSPDVVGGTVRISASEGFGTSVLSPSLARLSRQRPSLRIELAAHAGFLSASRREVDIAVTLSPPQGSRLVVEPLTTYQLALYASPAFIAEFGEPAAVDDLHRLHLVGYVDDLIYAAELKYLDEVSPGLKPHLASSSIQAQREMITSGAGVGVLPCFLADGLTRVLPDTVLERRFWLSTHQDVHDTARIRAVRHWLDNLVADERHRLSPFASKAKAPRKRQETPCRA